MAIFFFSRSRLAAAQDPAGLLAVAMAALTDCVRSSGRRPGG